MTEKYRTVLGDIIDLYVFPQPSNERVVQVEAFANVWENGTAKTVQLKSKDIFDLIVDGWKFRELAKAAKIKVEMNTP